MAPLFLSALRRGSALQAFCGRAAIPAGREEGWHRQLLRGAGGRKTKFE